MTSSEKKGYTTVPLGFNRQMLRAAVSGSKKNAIHCVTEINVSKARIFLREQYKKTGEKISFTAYIVRCFARAIQDHPQLNSFIKRNKLIILDDITISVMIEREIESEKIPEPLVINKAQKKTLKQIHHEIRKAQKHKSESLGSLSKFTWINFIPSFLLRSFIRLADQNIYMAKKYGKIAVTSVGMFTKSATWFIPHGTATVLLTIGGISEKIVQEKNEFVTREFLCITGSFDHEIVDGAPAARFMQQLTEIIESASMLKSELDESFN